MAHPVEYDLGNGAATLERLEPGFIVDRLRHAQQRATSIERVRSRKIERPRRRNGRRAERHRRVDQLGLVTDRPIVNEFPARCRRNQ